jgi:hypothetical protein
MPNNILFSTLSQTQWICVMPLMLETTFRTLTRQTINLVQCINKTLVFTVLCFITRVANCNHCFSLWHTRTLWNDELWNSCVGFVIRQGREQLCCRLPDDWPPHVTNAERQYVRKNVALWWSSGHQQQNAEVRIVAHIRHPTDTHISEASAAHMQISIYVFHVFCVVLHADGRRGKQDQCKSWERNFIGNALYGGCGLNYLKVLNHSALKSYGVWAALHHNLSNRSRWLVSFRFRSTYPRGKSLYTCWLGILEPVSMLFQQVSCWYCFVLNRSYQNIVENTLLRLKSHRFV